MITLQLDAFTQESPPAPIRRVTAPYQPTSETSKEAARLIAGHVRAMHRNILRLTVVRGGITRKDVERDLEMKTPTACARLRALEGAGKLQKLHELASDRHGQPYDAVVTRERCSVYVLGPKVQPEDWR